MPDALRGFLYIMVAILLIFVFLRGLEGLGWLMGTLVIVGGLWLASDLTKDKRR